MPLEPEIDEHFMRQAIAVAQRAWGDTHPNPLVGAIVVERERIVAEGWHERSGAPHAEINAIANHGHRPRYDATLYVTLEPCSTEGRTGACTTAIIERGFRRVVIGAIDPNPSHAGRGVEILREAGLEVVTNVLADECTAMNLIFNHSIVHETPLLAAKVAMTLDGKIATRAYHSKWITGELARADVMRWRRLFPAIAVGARTVIEDDPALTSRLPDEEPHCPVRFVFDRQLLTADHLASQVFCDPWRERTILVTENDCDRTKLRRFKEHGISCWELPTDPPEIYYNVFRKKCLIAGLNGVFYEGGCGLLSDLLSECALDYLFCYRAPKLLADDQALPGFRGLNTSEMGDAIVLEDVQHAIFGPDTLTRGRLVYPID